MAEFRLKTKKMKKTVIFSALLLLITIGCNHDTHIKAPTSVKVTKPWRQDVKIVNEYVAQIHAYQHIEIRAYERGYLQDIFVDEGQNIQSGESMFQLMPRLVESEYKKSKAEYDMTKIEYENTKKLARKKVVSKNELALAKAKLDKSEAELSLAKSHLDFATIKAPFNGMMDRMHVRIGSLIEEGELLTTLSDNSKMWVYFNVSEADYLDYMKFKKKDNEVEVRLKLANGDYFNQVGKIDTIEADFNHETGNVAFRSTFKNPHRLLRHGETGNVVLTEPIQNALVIPQKATFEILDKKFVYVIDKDNIVRSKQIEVEHELPHLFVLKTGLSEDEQIVLEGIGKVAVGEKVTMEYMENSRVVASLKLPLD